MKLSKFFFNKYPFPINFIHLNYLLKLIVIRIYYTFFFKLKLLFYGCEYGENLNVFGKIHLKSPLKSSLKIGKNCTLNSSTLSNFVGITNTTIFQILGQGKIFIGDNCGLTSIVFSCRENITIGNNVKIGGNVRVFDHDYHSLDYLKRRNVKTDSENCKSSPVTIEDDVFIGTNAIILKGVNIGARSVIGAGSVVAIKNIPPDSFVIGNPARIIKTN